METLSPNNEALYKAAEAAIALLFSDTSVSKQQTLDNMEALSDFCLDYATALEEELNKDEIDLDPTGRYT